MNYASRFAELVELTGDKTLLKPLSRDCAEEMFEAIEESKEQLRRFMPWENNCVKDVLAFIDRSESDRSEGTGLHLAILDRRDQSIMGVIGLFRFDAFTPRAEVGYWIRTSQTGRGIATDALSTIISYARDVLKLHRIDAKVSTTNVGSQKVVQKCGFVEEGRQQHAELIHGSWHDHIIYGLLLGQ